MKFSEIVEQAKVLLRRKERISYRALKMEFALDDEQLDILKEELVDIEALAVDKDGKMLVWMGKGVNGETGKGINGNQEGEKAKWEGGEGEAVSLQPPITYTPAHLAERIRAVSVTDGERKTITALFADLKGSSF